MIEHKTVSLADQVFEQLEEDILSGKYKRGDILTENTLSLNLGVSRTPIREALRRLSQEHLIDESGKGSVVVGITEQDLKDIFVVREKLETLVVSFAAKNATDEQLEKLKETLELQEFYVDKGNPEQIKQMDNRFHYMIYKMCGSTVFYDTLVPLHKKIQKYRRISVEKESRAKASVAEHRDIYDALIKRDAEKAEKATLIHISNAYDHIMGEK